MATVLSTDNDMSIHGIVALLAEEPGVGAIRFGV